MPKNKTRLSTFIPVSINRAQAAALADGFLDSFGSGKEGLQPRETFTEIILLAGELIEDCQDNLNHSNSNASGKLSASLIAGEPTQVGNGLQIDMLMNFYGQFVNKGVRGTKSGTSTAGYFFKYDLPSKKMVDTIRQWQNNGKLSSTNVNAKKTISRNEKKNASISTSDAAYAVARSIVQKGIKPTGFLDKAIVSTKEKVADRLGLALRIDIINSITGT